jgi:hypothetical protein
LLMTAVGKLEYLVVAAPIEALHRQQNDGQLMEEAAAQAGLTEGDDNLVGLLSIVTLVHKRCCELKDAFTLPLITTLADLHCNVSSYEFAPWTKTKLVECLTLDRATLVDMVGLCMAACQHASSQLDSQGSSTSHDIALALQATSSVLACLDEPALKTLAGFDESTDTSSSGLSVRFAAAICFAPAIELLHLLRRSSRFGRFLPDPPSPLESWARAKVEAEAEGSPAPAEPPVYADVLHKLGLANKHCLIKDTIGNGITQASQHYRLPSHLLTSMEDVIATLSYVLQDALNVVCLCCHPETVKPSQAIAEYLEELQSPAGTTARRQLLEDDLVASSVVMRLRGRQAASHRLQAGETDATETLWAWLRDNIDLRKEHPDAKEKVLCVKSALAGLAVLTSELSARPKLQRLLNLDVITTLPLLLRNEALVRKQQAPNFNASRAGIAMRVATLLLGRPSLSVTRLVGYSSVANYRIPVGIRPS